MARFFRPASARAPLIAPSAGPAMVVIFVRRKFRENWSFTSAIGLTCWKFRLCAGSSPRCDGVVVPARKRFAYSTPNSQNNANVDRLPESADIIFTLPVFPALQSRRYLSTAKRYVPHDSEYDGRCGRNVSFVELSQKSVSHVQNLFGYSGPVTGREK